MLLSSSHNFLFVAVPKTATSSIEAALEQWHDPVAAAGLGKHALLMEAESALGGAALEQLFKFAFVRNPYSWMYSWYRFRQRPALRKPEHPHHARYAGEMSFDEFMQVYNEGQIFLKQSDFLINSAGELQMDFVGRYESLEADFARACKHVGLPVATLQKVNVSKQDGVPEVSMSAASRKLINQAFERDFELFGYETVKG